MTMDNKRYPKGEPEDLEAALEQFSKEFEDLAKCATFDEVSATKLELYGPGPWMDEPDYEKYEYKGIDCLIKRTTSLGHLCGYVRVPKGHPWFGRDYDNIDYEPHGGLTFAEGTEEEWEIGFDCAHGGDLVPSFEHHRALLSNPFARLMSQPATPMTYKDFGFVKHELERLVDHMLGVASEPG